MLGNVMRHGEFYFGLQPELCVSIMACHMNMHTFFFK
jgi:hypothetical protein